VVALTANALQGEADICRAAGMDGYMFKPTNLPTLETMVLKWLPQAGPLRRGGSPPPPAPPLTKVVPRTKAPVDLAELARLLGSDDPATLADMLAMFWESESSMPETLRALAGARDGHGLKGAAHGAKGAAASVGALALAELCRALEQSAAMADWAAVERLMPQIDQAFAEVGAFIANARDNLETV
jgi:HPt (histidine-containing phosphotransfer) domain-containing protein